MYQRRVGVTGLLRICFIAGRMKRSREPRGTSSAAAETEKDHRIRQLERTLGHKAPEIEILKTSWKSEL
jgi:hypothetical protein